MFVVLLKFSINRKLAGQYLEAHNAWIQRGFDDGVFLLVGSLQEGLGGGILAKETNLSALQQRLLADPFVAEEVVSVEILQLTPNRTDDRLESLLAQPEAPAGDDHG